MLLFAVFTFSGAFFFLPSLLRRNRIYGNWKKERKRILFFPRSSLRFSGGLTLQIVFSYWAKAVGWRIHTYDLRAGKERNFSLSFSVHLKGKEQEGKGSRMERERERRGKVSCTHNHECEKVRKSERKKWPFHWVDINDSLREVSYRVQTKVTCNVGKLYIHIYRNAQPTVNGPTVWHLSFRIEWLILYLNLCDMAIWYTYAELLSLSLYIISLSITNILLKQLISGNFCGTLQTRIMWL